MSTTIDQRVVEMRFDNKHFESNVSATMSTLDKLKQKLHLDGATKGLENVNTAAKNVKMDGLGTAVENVRMRFSALEVMGVTALANITNSAVNAGKRIVSALTIDPIRSGLDEYETKMGSIQTILANTEHQGTTLDDVTAALDKLNTYADKTIYNFQQMTRNIGTFTAAGVDLDTSVKSIQGIANLAAVSGSTSQQASTAMYQLSQALASGTVKLMDWNSVVNAGMGGKVFQNALIRTAAMLDGAAADVEAWQKKNVDAHGSFRDSLTSGAWLTTEVLTKTLEQFTMAAEEGSEEWKAFKKELMDMGYAEAQAEEILKMANTATDAATKVKTFTQLFETLKESAQSGWAQTWELIFGDFEEAKEFFTGLSDSIGGLLNMMSEWRNNIVGEAFNSNWDKLVDKLGIAGVKTTEYEEKIRDVMKAHGETDDSIDKLVEEYGSLEKAVKSGAIGADILKEALSKLGIATDGSTKGVAAFVEGLEKIERMLGWGAVGDDVKSLQTALEALGHSVGECKIDGIIGPDTTKAIKEFQESAGLVVDGIAGPETLAALKKAGTEIEDLSGDVKKVDESYDDLIDNITKRGGRELFLEGFQNVIGSLIDILKIFGKAWSNIFPAEGIQNSLFRAIEGFNKLAKSLRLYVDVTDEAGNTTSELTNTGKNILRTFEGLLAVIDIIATVVGGPLKFAIKLVAEILSKAGLSILDVTAAIGDVLVSFRDTVDKVIGGMTDFIVEHVTKWIDKFKETEFFKTVSGWIVDAGESISNAIEDISKAFDNFEASGVAKRIEKFASIITDVAKTIRNSDIVVSIVDGVCAAFDKVKEFFGKFKLPEFNIDNLKNFFTNFVKIGEKIGDVGGKGLGSAIVGFGKHLKDNVISWNWTVFKETALEKFVTFWIKTGDKVKQAFEKTKEAMQAIKEFIFGSQEVTLPDILEVVKTFLGIIVLIKALQLLNTLAAPFDNVTDALNNLSSNLKWQAIGSAIKGIALCLGALTLCIIILSSMDPKDALINAGILAGLMAVLTGAIVAVAFFTKKWDGLNMAGAAASLLMISASILLLVGVLKQIDNLNLKNTGKTFMILAGILAALTVGISMISKAAGSSFRSVAAILTLMGALKLILDVIDAYDKYDWSGKQDAINKMTGMLLGLSVAINLASRGIKAGSSAQGLAMTILAMVLSLKMLLGVMTEYAAMDTDDIIKGGLVVTALMGVMTTMMAVLNATSKGNILEKGQRSVNNFTGLALALIVMVGAIWALGKMDTKVLIQGGLAVTAVILMLTGLLAVISKANANLKEGTKAVNHFVGLAMTLAAIVGAIYILGNIKDVEVLKRGCLAVGGILLTLTAMLAVIGKTCGGIKAGSITAMLSTLGVIVVLLAVVLWRMEGLDTTKALSNAAALSALLVALSIAMRSVKAGNQKVGDLIKWAGAMVALSGLLFVLGFLLDQINDLDPVNAIASATALGILLTAMSGACAILGKVKFGDMTMAIGAMAGLVIILAALAVIISMMRGIDPGNAIGNVAALSILLNAMSSALLILSFAKDISMDALKGMVILTAVLFRLAVVLQVVKNIDPANAIGNVTALSIMLNAMSSALLILSFAKDISMDALKGMAVLTAVLFGLSVILLFIQDIDPGKAIGQVTALSILLNAMSSALLILSFAKDISLTALGGVAILTIVLYAITDILHQLKSIDPGKAIGQVTALSILLNAMSSALLILSFAKDISTMALIGMAALAGVLYLLVPTINLLQGLELPIGQVISLSVLLNAMSSALLILSYNKKISIMALAGMAALAGVLRLLVPTIELLQGLELPIGNAISLSVLLNAMASALLILSYSGTISPMALVGMAAMGLVVAELAYVLAELAKMKCALSISTAISLSVMLLAMASVYAILSLTGGMASVAIQGAIGMIAVIGILGAVAIAIGGIMSLIPAETISAWKTGLQDFLDFLVILAEGLGSIVSGFVVGFTDGLAEAGENLKLFANSIAEIDPAAVDGVQALCDAVNKLTAANFKDALVNLLPGDNSLSTFGENIAAFATCIMDAAGSLSLITDTDVENIKRAATAGSALADLNAAIPRQGGWAQSILGAQDLSVWGQSIVAFAGCLVRYSNTVKGSAIDVEAVKNSAAAGTSLSDLSNAIPKQDGWAQEILGDQDLATFGKSIVAFGRCLVDYSAIVTGQPIDKEAILLSADAGTALAELADVIPKQDGWWQEIAGEQDLGTFGRSLTAFANGVLSYCRVAVQIDDEKVEAIKKSGTAIDEIVKVMDKIPEEGGWGEAIFGGQDGNSFGQALSSVARGVLSYCNMAAQIDDDDLTAIGNTGDAIAKLGEVLENVPDTGDSEKTAAFSTAVTDISSIASTINTLTASGYEYSGLDSLKTAISTLSTIVTDLDTTAIFSGFSNLKAAVENAILCADKMFELGGYTYTGIDSFKQALTDLAGADLQGVIDAFSGKAESMTSAINTLISGMAEGISGGSEKVVGAMNGLIGDLLTSMGSKLSEFKKTGKNFSTNIQTGLAEVDLNKAGSTSAGKAVTGARAKYGAMVSAGTYLGEGLVAGIKSKETAVYNAAYALGQKAVQGEKDGQASNSPSKLTIQAGKWLGEGLIIGIKKMGDSVYNAGANLGKTATGTISTAIAKVADMVDNDIDAQPTIRPVLDLSDVESGVGTIGSMLGLGSSIGLSANVGAISSMMSARNQNGVNHEVVSAIDKLRNDLGKVGNTTYHIDGVTYDDGSNVSEAIKTIVRYATIERRV